MFIYPFLLLVYRNIFFTLYGAHPRNNGMLLLSDRQERMTARSEPKRESLLSNFYGCYMVLSVHSLERRIWKVKAATIIIVPEESQEDVK